jgi:hypothetical protein
VAIVEQTLGQVGPDKTCSAGDKCVHFSGLWAVTRDP